MHSHNLKSILILTGILGGYSLGGRSDILVVVRMILVFLLTLTAAFLWKPPPSDIRRVSSSFPM